MYTISLNFGVMNSFDAENQMDVINSLLGAWRMNGQILGKQFPTAKNETGYIVFVNTPESDSVSDKYQNIYVKKFEDKLASVGLYKPDIVVVGKEPEGLESCLCSKSEFYILFTTYVTLTTPLRCGHCFNIVPLYKIPKTDNDEYFNLMCWQSDYHSCDSLQMNCSVGERFANNQMSNLDSSLTRIGLEVCESIASKTDIPVYYYLYKGRGKSHRNENLRKCPKCSGEWLLSEPLHGVFNFKCSECKLLSNIAWDVQ